MACEKMASRKIVRCARHIENGFKFEHSMNDFPVIRYLCYTHRILGSRGGKHC